MPVGYEAAHQEWLRAGAGTFRARFRFGAPKEFYTTPYWAMVRQSTLERDGFKCFRCGAACEEVHHLHYEYIGADHLHPESMVSACRVCHGLVEYGRNAQSLIPKIKRRIASCRGFVEGKKGYEDHTPVKAFARLLEYRDELAELKHLYTTGVPFSTVRERKQPSDPSQTELDSHNLRVREQRELELQLHTFSKAYWEDAEEVVNQWLGTDREKVERIVELLADEIQKCSQFADQVLQPKSFLT